MAFIALKPEGTRSARGKGSSKCSASQVCMIQDTTILYPVHHSYKFDIECRLTNLHKEM